MTNPDRAQNLNTYAPAGIASSPLPPRTLQLLGAGCILVGFCIPLKLAFTYAILIPLIAVWILSKRWAYHGWTGTAAESSVLVPLAFFLLSTSCAAIVGINPIHSLSPLISLAFFSLTIFVFRDFGNSYYVLLALLSGQTLAALHSVVDAASRQSFPDIFLGSVTESGQLALSLLVCIGMLWQKYHDGKDRLPPSIPRVATATSGISLLMLACLGFYSTANLSGVLLTIAWGCGFLLLKHLLKNAPRSLPEARGILTLSTVYFPLLLCALLVNLKRGPWLGVVVGLATFCLFYARKLLALVIIGAVVTSVSVPPIRDRLASSYEHFTISGGRSTIWKIGVELASKYPLGVGYHNSGILRTFSLEIPPELKHFHNNLINIAAESGVLTASIFIWFIYCLVRLCFRRPLSVLHVALGCAIISWQTAGLVEYNFGDSEVMLIVWLLLGSILGDLRKRAAF
jgi:hypothetical protein